MGARGPKKKPAHLALVTEKSKTKRKILAERVSLEPDNDRVAPPDYLDGRALELWNYWAPDCKRRGVLTNLEVEAFADMCRTMEVIERCMSEVLRDGVTVEGAQGVRVRHPAITVANSSKQALMRYMDRFGIGAAARASLPKPDTDTKDPWEK